MQIELSNEEIKILHGLLDEVVYIGACKVEGVDDLLDRFTALLEEVKELESLDFDDCAGGACKL